MLPLLSNRLLEALPRADKALLLATVNPVPLATRYTLYSGGDAPQYGHFITSGIASKVLTLSNGETVEIGLTGFEGCPELIHLLGSQNNTTSCFMQVQGTGLRMDFTRLRELFEQNASIRRTILQYVQYESLITSQLILCNQFHTIQQRMARWLLMVSTRVGSSDLVLTQEFLGDMIGAGRATVSITAGHLQRRGLIEYRRGHLRILNRAGLEKVACECLETTERLLKDIYT